jgi:hypothetical protein
MKNQSSLEANKPEFDKVEILPSGHKRALVTCRNRVWSITYAKATDVTAEKVLTDWRNDRKYFTPYLG